MVLRGKARKLVEDFGYLFEALTNGTLQPIDAAEKEFIEEIRQNTPTTDCAKAWQRYRNKEKVENSIGANQSPRLIEDPFLTREGSAKIRNDLRSDWKARSRKMD
jgi:uncharacterized protein YifE (UPF0438 family)